VLEPYADGAEAVEVEGGPAVALAPRRAQALALVLHELATNAVKHGALSAPGGRVRVGWDGRGGGGTAGGAPAAAALGGAGRPAGRAAGLARLRHASDRDSRGARAGRRAELTFAPEGLAAEITALLLG
jgi:two-component sensor histidine kinase